MKDIKNPKQTGFAFNEIDDSIDYYWDDANYIHLKFWHMWKMYNFTEEFIKEELAKTPYTAAICYAERKDNMSIH